jgi:hypothetical protein
MASEGAECAPKTWPERSRERHLWESARAQYGTERALVAGEGDEPAEKGLRRFTGRCP